MPRNTPKLVMARQEAQNELVIQITKAKSLFNRDLTAERQDEVELKFPKWNQDNIELLKDIFDNPDELIEEYESARQPGSSAYGGEIDRFIKYDNSLGGKIKWLTALKDERIQLYAETLRVPENVLPEGSEILRIFIGHGRSTVWKDLRDFLRDTLLLPFEEFNRESAAGIPTPVRLTQMVNNSNFAFLIMTAEDEHTDNTYHGRENVIHEAGLFQGRLGFEKAIILLEDGCKEFSNVVGLGHISFPKGNIRAAFEDIRNVLTREKILP